jgi:hypothetical protein
MGMFKNLAIWLACFYVDACCALREYYCRLVALIFTLIATTQPSHDIMVFVNGENVKLQYLSYVNTHNDQSIGSFCRWMRRYGINARRLEIFVYSGTIRATHIDLVNDIDMKTGKPLLNDSLNIRDLPWNFLSHITEQPENVN